MDPVAFSRFLGLDALLEGQDGVVRRDQAVAAGVDRATIDNSIRRGRWIRLFPRVYLTTRKAPTTRARIRACWLWAGDHSVIAGSAAAWWLGLNPAVPRTISVVIPPSTKRNPQPDVQVIRGIVDPRDADFEDWIKVTRASRTCLDLARRQEPDPRDRTSPAQDRPRAVGAVAGSWARPPRPIACADCRGGGIGQPVGTE